MQSLHRKLGLAFLANEINRLPLNALIHIAGAGKRSFPELFTGRRVFYSDKKPFRGLDCEYDLLTSPDPKWKFDAIILSEVLEHIPEPVLAIGNCYSMLKLGGKLIGTVPYHIKLHNEPEDFYRYTLHGLYYLLDKGGFTDIFIKPLGDATAWMNRNRVNPRFPLLYGFSAQKR